MPRVIKRGRPTRRDLLLVIGELQTLVGQTISAYSDRNPERARDIANFTGRAHDLCVEARSFDPPIEGGSRRGWPYPKESVKP
jgi:hypothetical protein